ncbi:MAG TPA: murein biosynthesis integral membrane protein MurJ [Vicinamibacterales bacterium]|jgi:putative peptidoglycan lipid II flippase
MSSISDGAPNESAASKSGSRLARSAGIIGLATMTSRVLGLVREQVLAYYFGAGNAMDAFVIAFRIPNLLRDLFAEGAMSAAFVPTFTRQLTLSGKPRAWRLGNNVITALTAITIPLTILGMVFAEPLVRLYAEDFSRVPGKLELTVQLTRIMLPFLTLVAVAAALMGMLNAMHRFFVPALSPAMFNVGTIVCAVTLVGVMPRLGLDPVVAIAIGTIVGGLGQVLLQWPALDREGFRYWPSFDWSDPELRRVAALMGPSIIGLAAVQVNLFVNSILATGEGTGAVSWLSYAFRLMYLPIGLFGVSIATAAIPGISTHAAREELTAMRGAIARGLRMMLMLNIPATLGLVALARPVVGLIFERGEFTSADTNATAIALMFYAPGLIGYSFVKLASPAFYALHDSRTPVIVSILTMVLNIVLNITLVRLMGYSGLALGTALAALFNASVLLWRLRGRLDGLEGTRLAISLGKIMAASAVMAAGAWAVERGMHTILPGTDLTIRILHVGSSIAVGLVVLAVSAHMLNITEFGDARRLVLARVRRTARPE